MDISHKYPLLERINSPADLKTLNESELLVLAGQVREFMIESVSRSGGHLASSLGAVELAVALHYIFDTPEDRIIWDVGHQAYAHKILTGRCELMPTIRRKDGLSGFPCRSESEYDCFGVGHSSTSISAALGMAVAAARQGNEKECIAVIGDGAMTAGEAFEALDHAGGERAKLLVILNDNNMSISENVGALTKHFGKLISGKIYAQVRERSKRLLQHMPESVLDFARRVEEHMKGMVVPGTLFEEMGFTYFGPVDGHDFETLINALINIKSLDGPRLLHVVTQKGKGYAPAEENPITYHGVTPFNPEHGVEKKTEEKPTFTQVFGRWVCDMAEADKRIIAITPAMREGSGLVEFSQRFPDRFFDVAIAEQHCVTFAAGLAAEGMRPVVAIYSTFLQRAYDQLIHDVAIQNLPVVFAIDRAGIVGPDGATHNGCFDISFLRCIPNMTVMVPATAAECRQMLSTAIGVDGPVAVRYPRAVAVDLDEEQALSTLSIGKAEIVHQGDNKAAILVFGSLLDDALSVGKQLNITVVNMRFVKPLDEIMINELATSHERLVTLEDNALQGGAGSAVAESLQHQGLQIPLRCLGIPDEVTRHGSRSEILAEYGLDIEGILNSIKEFLQIEDCHNCVNALIS